MRTNIFTEDFIDAEPNTCSVPTYSVSLPFLAALQVWAAAAGAAGAFGPKELADLARTIISPYADEDETLPLLVEEANRRALFRHGADNAFNPDSYACDPRRIEPPTNGELRWETSGVVRLSPVGGLWKVEVWSTSDYRVEAARAAEAAVRPAAERELAHQIRWANSRV